MDWISGAITLDAITFIISAIVMIQVDSNVKNVAGHSGALSAPIKTHTSGGYAPGIMEKGQVAVPMG